MRVALLLGLTLASLARGQDAFEIQVYDSHTAPLGQVGFELHTLYVAQGTTTVPRGEHPSNRSLHLTLEPHLGLASWAEAGMYFLTALGSDGHYDFAGVKARLKVRWPELLGGHVGLSLNQELTLSGGSWESEQGFEWELRPIIDADFTRFYFSVNPIVGSVLSGAAAGEVAFEPAVKASVKLTPQVMIGGEYFASIDLTGVSPGQRSQRLFLTLDSQFTLGPAELAVNAGFGYDFVGSDKLVAKLIIGVDFPPAASERKPEPRLARLAPGPTLRR